MAAVYTVRELSYAFAVEWEGETCREVALVLIRDEQLRRMHCLRCDDDDCDHARRVVHHLIDLESS